MKNTYYLSGVLLSIAMLAIGCSSSDSPVTSSAQVPVVNETPSGTSDDGDTPVIGDVPTMPPLLELELTRDINGNILFDKTRSIPSLIGAYRPWSAYEGDMAAVAYQGNRVVDAALISFTSYFRISHQREVAEGVADPDQEAETQLSKIVVHLDASEAIDRVDIVDTSMNILATLDAIPDSEGIQSRARNGLFPNQPWIRLLDSGDSDQLPESKASEPLKTPTFADTEQLRRALDAMPPRLQQSVYSIGLLQNSEAANNGFNTRGLVFLRPATEFQMAGTLFHETAHAYSRVSNSLSTYLNVDVGLDQWPPAIRQAVQQTHEDLGLDLFQDVLDLWQELHETAMGEGLTVAYGSSPADVFAYKHGFATNDAYASFDEDFAETVHVANLQAIIDSVNGSVDLRSNIANSCVGYQAADKLEKETALAYIKFQIVRLLGLVEAASLDWCLGNVAPTTTPGFEFPNGVSTRLDTPAEDYTFNIDMSAGYTDADREEFVIVAQDSENRGIGIELDTDGGSPLGVFALDSSWWGRLFPENDLYVAPLIEGIAGKARTTKQGVVVITYAKSGERVDGFIYNLILLDAFGGEYTYDFVPFRIPL